MACSNIVAPLEWETFLYVKDSLKCDLDGIYTRMPEKHCQGLPVWRRSDGRGFMYASPLGCWSLCKTEEAIAEDLAVCDSAKHDQQAPYAPEVAPWKTRKFASKSLNLRVIALSTVKWDDVVYIRCEERNDLTGEYRRVTTKSWEGLPIWRKESDPPRFLYSFKGRSWNICCSETSMEAGMSFCAAGPHRLRPPTCPDLYPWALTGGGKKMTGLVLSNSPDPPLPATWTEKIWQIQKLVNTTVYVTQRDAMKERLEELGQSILSVELRSNSKSKTHLSEVKQHKRRGTSLVNALIEGCFPDVELSVGNVRLPASSEALSKKSPVFRAMLDSSMQESRSGTICLPAGDVDAVRSLLCLMHSDGDEEVVSALDSKLNAKQLLNVLAQADEWQCGDVTKRLLAKVKDKLSNASASTALPFLKLAALHIDEKNKKLRAEWRLVMELSAERFAETCMSDLSSLEHLPFVALHCVIRQNSLDTGGREGALLVALSKWMQTHGHDKIPELLEHVRFPLLHLACLDENEKAALRSLREIAGADIQRLLVEAFALQVSRKRPREEGSDSQEGEGAFLKRVRATPRRGGDSIPVLDELEAGQVLCQGLL